LSDATEENAEHVADCEKTINSLTAQKATTEQKIANLKQQIANDEEVLATAKVDLAEAKQDYAETVQSKETGTAER
jgi:peptidoglycan hydrolase CwlO-like protein